MTSLRKKNGESVKPAALLRLTGASLLSITLLMPPGAAPSVAAGPGADGVRQGPPSHAGELLVAAPGMQDPRFRRSVILIVRHDDSGAFGLIVNRVAGTAKLARLFKQLGLKAPAGAGNVADEIALHYGGPVQPQLGFVLHSTEALSPTQRVDGNTGVSPFEKILRAMALGEAPRRSMFTLGYAGWGPSQLESEMHRGDWFTAPTDESLLFDRDQESKWKRAMESRYRTL
jgi:putative transcriptional regulator